MDWYPWNFMLYKTDTMHLNPYQDGCYRRLIDHYMQTRQALPDNDAALARIVGDTLENWVAMASPIVRPFFDAKNGRLFLKRCEINLAQQDRLTKKLSESGKNGANKRWNKINNNDSPPIAPLMAFDSIGQEEDRKKKEEKIPKRKLPRLDGTTKRQLAMSELDRALDASFENFWISFPSQRKGGKGNARRAFFSAMKRATFEEILNGTKSYAKSEEVDRGFAKGAAAWLNDDRWTTDYTRKTHENASRQPSYSERLKAAGDRATASFLAELEQQPRIENEQGKVLSIAKPDDTIL